MTTVTDAIDAIREGRPDLAPYLVGIWIPTRNPARHGAGYWADMPGRERSIQDARGDYDRGTHELCQVKVEGYYGLVSLPRKRITVRASYQKFSGPSARPAA